MSTVRVVTYNLRVAAAADGEPPWAERRDAVASTIRFHNVDVAGVQEALPHMLADLDDRLGEYTWVGTGRRGDLNEHCALFYRKAQIDPSRHDTFWLSETPSTPGSVSWGAAVPRIVTWAAFQLPDVSSPFFVFNCHFDHHSARARRESARLLRNQIPAVAATAPGAVIGDFNATPDSQTYRILTEDGSQSPLRDALHESVQPHHGPIETFNGFDTSTQGNARIDYVFVRGRIRVLRHGTLTDHWNDQIPSDHYPVLAELVLTSSDG